MMGGDIAVESTYGEGSTFTARMLQEVVDDTPIGDYEKHLAEAQAENEEFRPQLVAPDARILIVDDNEMNLEVITELMNETRMKITTALSGQECIDLLERASYDVVLLDQMMPGMSGTQALRVIRERHLADDTPIIVLTADAIVGARESYVGEGFTDYLSKPVLYPELEALLYKYIAPEKILDPKEAEAHRVHHSEEQNDADRPVALVISDSPERLNEAKSLISEKYKGVFVKDEEHAKRYMEKHEVAFVVRDAGNHGV